MKISAQLSSSELSHKLDTEKGLANFVRLSFSKKHPMMYVALREKRISVPVVLEIKLEVVSRPGVLFCGGNAAAKGAKASESPHVIRYDVVAADSQRAVDQRLRPSFGRSACPRLDPSALDQDSKGRRFYKPLGAQTQAADNSEYSAL